jgi:glycosyltransferase 2 family protein
VLFVAAPRVRVATLQQYLSAFGRTPRRHLIATATTAACVVYLLANTNLGLLAPALQKTNLSWLALALVLSTSTVLIKGVRWWVLYPPDVRPRLGLAIAGISAGQVANWAAPLRLGEVLRVALVASGDPAERGRAVATGTGVLVIEKVLDSAALVLTVAVLVALIGVPLWLSLVVLIGSGVACLAGFALAHQLHHRRSIRAVSTISAWVTRWLPMRAAKVLDGATGVSEGFSAWLGSGIASIVFTTTFAAWAIGAATNYVGFNSVGIDLPEAVAPSLAVLAALYGAAIVPTLPGRFGVFQYVCITTLAPFGVGFEQALVFSIALYTAIYLPPIAIGLASVFFFGWAPWHVAAVPPSRS